MGPPKVQEQTSAGPSSSSSNASLSSLSSYSILKWKEAVVNHKSFNFHPPFFCDSTRVLQCTDVSAMVRQKNFVSRDMSYLRASEDPAELKTLLCQLTHNPTHYSTHITTTHYPLPTTHLLRCWDVAPSPLLTLKSRHQRVIIKIIIIITIIITTITITTTIIIIITRP